MLATYPAVRTRPQPRRSEGGNVVRFPRVRVNPEYGWTADGSMIVRRSDGLLIHPSAWAGARG